MKKTGLKTIIKEIVSECLKEVGELDATAASAATMDTHMGAVGATDKKAAEIDQKLQAAGAKPNKGVKALLAALRYQDLVKFRELIDQELQKTGKKSATDMSGGDDKYLGQQSEPKFKPEPLA